MISLFAKGIRQRLPDFFESLPHVAKRDTVIRPFLGLFHKVVVDPILIINRGRVHRHAHSLMIGQAQRGKRSEDPIFVYGINTLVHVSSPPVRR